MRVSKAILDNINESILSEKASIDWNNYLTLEEVKKFLSKDNKIESAKDIIYSNNFKDRFKDFKKSNWTKNELVKDLENYYNYGHFNESDNTKSQLELWKSQVDSKSNDELRSLLDKLYTNIQNYNKTNNEIKSKEIFDLIKKANYIENKLGVKITRGRILH
jgi:arsenate reductase-like glutaredoxin family protein